MTSSGKEFHWVEYFRLLTPILIFALGIYVSSVKSDINRLELRIISIDDKMFKHLTNDELHSPRSLVITKPEFAIYQDMRNKQMDSIEKAVGEIKDSIRYHIQQIGSK